MLGIYPASILDSSLCSAFRCLLVAPPKRNRAMDETFDEDSLLWPKLT